MYNLRIKLSDGDITELEELMNILQWSRSQVIRIALCKGLRNMKLEISQKKYQNNEFTLCKAAEYANVSIQEMVDYLAKREIPFFKYPECIE